jgi:hypothetical protein
MACHREHCQGDLPWDDFFTDRDFFLWKQEGHASTVILLEMKG